MSNFYACKLNIDTTYKIKMRTPHLPSHLIIKERYDQYLTIHHKFMSILIIYEKHKVRSCLHIKWCCNIKIFNYGTQFWFCTSIVKSISVLINKTEVIQTVSLDFITNFLNTKLLPIFQSSIVIFILKYHITSSDCLNFLIVVQNLLDRLSWNFVYACLKLWN